MGSLPKQKEEVKYIVTGFCEFQGVAKNPTQEIVEELLTFKKDAQNQDTSAFFDCSALKVSAHTCDDYLEQMAQRVSQEITHDQPVVWIHLGVDPGAKEIAVETQAINNATFLSPDEDNCLYNYYAIDPQIPYDNAIQTKLNIDAVVERLAQKNMHVRKSLDAGRFICNWIYFRSLRQAETLEKQNWFSVFVHVPQFQHISKENQLQMIAALIDAIGQEAQEAVALQKTPMHP